MTFPEPYLRLVQVVIWVLALGLSADFPDRGGRSDDFAGAETTSDVSTSIDEAGPVLQKRAVQKPSFSRVDPPEGGQSLLPPTDWHVLAGWHLTVVEPPVFEAETWFDLGRQEVAAVVCWGRPTARAPPTA